MVSSVHVLGLALLSAATFVRTAAAPQFDTSPSDSPASITVDVQTFGRPHADFPATIQIHSSVLDSDLSSTSDKPSSVSFPNLPAGPYRITVTAPSREAAQLELTLSPGQSAKLSLIVDRVFPLKLSFDSLPASAPAPASAATMSGGSSAPPEASPANGSSPVPMSSSLWPASDSIRAAATSQSEGPSSAEPAPSSDSSDSPDLPSFSAEASSAKPQPFVGTCSADAVIPHVSAHVQQFVESINRITATEFMDFERHSMKGRLEEQAKNKVNYVAVIAPLENGFLSVEEYRNGSPGMASFPGHIASTGSVALALIFHPKHLDEFEMTCRGITVWHDLPVYEIVFQQRTNVPNTMSEFRVGKASYDIYLKGTAFVDLDSFQIIHLDTDLLKPIPEVLDFEHQAVDYGSVAFSTRNDELWLPQSAVISVRFRKKQFVEHHAYSGYRLFTVDTGQKISKPTMPADPNGPSPN